MLEILKPFLSPDDPPTAPLKNSESPLRFDDPIVSEVRETRHRLTAIFSNDVTRIARNLMARQRLLGSRLRNEKR